MIKKSPNKIVCIVQARMGSSRLPGKVLKKINGTPMVGHCLARLKLANSINKIILATTDLDDDLELCRYAQSIDDIFVFRGNADDVLNRYRKCAQEHNADIIVRATADNPLVDPKIVDEIVNFFLNNKNIDYCSNKISPSFPMGFDIEVFSFDTLKTIDDECEDKYDREHVTPPILRQQDRFFIKNFRSKLNNSDLRLTVDYQSDFELVEKIFSHFKSNKEFTCEDVVLFLRENPSLITLDEKLLLDMKKKRREFR